MQYNAFVLVLILKHDV